MNAPFRDKEIENMKRGYKNKKMMKKKTQQQQHILTGGPEGEKLEKRKKRDTIKNLISRFKNWPKPLLSNPEQGITSL